MHTLFGITLVFSLKFVDFQIRLHYQQTHLSIVPSEFVLPERSSKVGHELFTSTFAWCQRSLDVVVSKITCGVNVHGRSYIEPPTGEFKQYNNILLLMQIKQ